MKRRNFPAALLALALVLHLEVVELDAGLLGERERAVVDAFIETLVELAAHGIDQRRADRRRRACGQHRRSKDKTCPGKQSSNRHVHPNNIHPYQDRSCKA